jgi:hypothetical protein
MALNLQVAQALSTTPQVVQDANGNNSALSASTAKVGVGVNGWTSGSVAECDFGDGSTYVQNNWGGNFVISSNNAMIIQTSASNRNIALMPNGTGKVGVGNSNPSEKLDVNGNIKTNGCVNINGAKIFSGNGNPIISAPIGSLYLRTDATSRNDRLWIAVDNGGGWTYIPTNQ